MMHGPPEVEGAKTIINLPLFVPADESRTMRNLYSQTGAEPCDHPWGNVQYPTYTMCARCGERTS